jgi:hypothetical protein
MMLPKKINIISLIFLFFLVVQCSGTGSKSIPSLSSSSSQGETNLFFVREGGYVAGGVLAKLDVNGNEIARLGTKEYIKHAVSENFRIRVSGAGLGGLGMGSDSISGNANNKNYFYIIGVKQGLFSAKFTIQETTESGYKQSQ